MASIGNGTLMWTGVQQPGNFGQKVEAAVGRTWNAVVETPRGLALVITLLFLGVWGTFGFALAVQSAAACILGRIAYVAWRDRGLSHVVEDQSAQIGVLQNTVKNLAGQVAEQDKINRKQHEDFKAMTARNKILFVKKERLAVERSDLLRKRESAETKLVDSELRWKEAYAQQQFERQLKEKAEKEAARIEGENGRLMKERDAALAQAKQKAEALTNAFQQFSVSKFMGASGHVYNQIELHLKEIAECLKKDDVNGAQKKGTELVPNVQELIGKVMQLIASQAELLSDIETKASLLVLNVRLAQISGILAIVPRIVPPKCFGPSSESVQFLRMATGLDSTPE